MFAPDDPLTPPSGTFAEPWQATTLAIVTAMIRQGHFTQSDWAEALGAALQKAEDDGLPDTDDTYFLAALAALETLADGSGMAESERQARKAAWEDAYRRTPHGQPVVLG